MEHQCSPLPPTPICFSPWPTRCARGFPSRGGMSELGMCHVTAEGLQSFGWRCRHPYPCLYPCHRTSPSYHDHVLCPIWAHWGTQGHFSQGCSALGGGQWTRCFLFLVAVGGAFESTLERIGIRCPPPQLIRFSPWPPSCAHGFPSRGGGPSSGCYVGPTCKF